MVDALFFFVVAIAAFVGWRKGLVLSTIGIGGLLLAYAAAYLLYRPLGGVLGHLFDLQPLLARPLGGLLAFLLVLLLAALVGQAVRRRRRGREPHLFDRLGGGVVGAACGGAIGLAAVWGLMVAESLAPERMPSARTSLAATWVEPLAERFGAAVGRRTSSSPLVAAAAASFTSNPATAAEDLGVLVRDQRVRALVRNRRLRAAVSRADVEAVAGSKPLRALARDDQFVIRARRLGLLEQRGGAIAPQELQRQLAHELMPLARSVAELARDPEVKRLLKDPALARRLERQDVLGLANDPKFNQLADIVVRHLEQSGADTPRRNE